MFYPHSNGRCSKELKDSFGTTVHPKACLTIFCTRLTLSCARQVYRLYNDKLFSCLPGNTPFLSLHSNLKDATYMGPDGTAYSYLTKTVASKIMDLIQYLYGKKYCLFQYYNGIRYDGKR